MVRPVRAVARTGYVIMAWAVVALIFVQVFHAGAAVLVHPGNWGAHTNFGHLLAWPIVAMFALSILAWLPLRFLLFSVGLWALYFLQYVFLYLAPAGLAGVRALHAVNALVLLLAAIGAARQAWRLCGGGRRLCGGATRHPAR